MTTPSTRTVPTTRAWIIAVFVVFTLSGLDIATWLGRIPSVRDSLGASTFEMGLLVLGMAVGSIGGLTFAGHIVAKLGARRGSRSPPPAWHSAWSSPVSRSRSGGASPPSGSP